MNNPPLLLKSLNYSVGELYSNLGTYIGIINNEYLLFVDSNTVYKQDIDIHNIEFVPSRIELEYIIERGPLIYNTIPELFEIHNLLFHLQRESISKFTLPELAVYIREILVLVNRIYE